MNLIEEAWIPVLQQSGVGRNVSLRKLFSNGQEFVDLVLRPHEMVAVMRLLICIAQASLDGPEGSDDWHDALANLPQAADDYLTTWSKKKAFELISSEKPFLQIADLEPSDPTKKKPSTNLLDFSMAAGNNSTLFDQKGDDLSPRSLTSSQLAIGLISFQNFSSGGGASIVRWGKIKTGQVGNPDAPCLKGSPYHSFLRGHNLLETICLNLLTKETVESHYGEKGWGKPIWEHVPQNPKDGAAIINTTETYLGRLVPMARWIKIINDKEMLWGNGFKYAVFPDFKCREPSTTSTLFNIKNKDVRGILGANHSRAVWRKLAAIVTRRSQNDVGGPLTIGNAPEGKSYDIHVCALLRKQATIEAYQEAIFHIPQTLNIDAALAAYEDEVKFAERKASNLGLAVETWRQEIDPDWAQRIKKAGKNKNILKEQLHSIATTHYWTAVEKNLPLLMDYIASFGDAELVINTKKAWRRLLHRTARESYEVACGHETPRQLRAFSFGLKILEGHGKHKEEVTE